MLCRDAQIAHLSRLIKYKFATRLRLPKQKQTNKKSKKDLKISPVINLLLDNLWAIYTVNILFAYVRYLSKAAEVFSKLHSDFPIKYII